MVRGKNIGRDESYMNEPQPLWVHHADLQANFFRQSIHYCSPNTNTGPAALSGIMLFRLAVLCLSLASYITAIPLQPSIRSDNGVSGDANTASLSCGSQYISCCTDDSSVCNLAKTWHGDLGEVPSVLLCHSFC